MLVLLLVIVVLVLSSYTVAGRPVIDVDFTVDESRNTCNPFFAKFSGPLHLAAAEKVVSQNPGGMGPAEDQ